MNLDIDIKQETLCRRHAKSLLDLLQRDVCIGHGVIDGMRNRPQQTAERLLLIELDSVRHHGGEVTHRIKECRIGTSGCRGPYDDLVQAIQLVQGYCNRRVHQIEERRVMASGEGIQTVETPLLELELQPLRRDRTLALGRST